MMHFFPHITADEWKNFVQRFDNKSEEKLRVENEEDLRLWASYRGQTLTKTGTNDFLSLHQPFYMSDAWFKVLFFIL